MNFLHRDQDELFAEPITATIESIEPNHAVWVHCLGTSWNTLVYADFPSSTIHPGACVTVVGRRGTKLLIAPDRSKVGV
jgi:membrane protein implicated in regulation of membrane protease activity